MRVKNNMREKRIEVVFKQKNILHILTLNTLKADRTGRRVITLPRRVAGWGVGVFALLSLVSVSALAQEYRGTITGQVTDPSGNVVVDATVTAKSPEQTYNGKTDKSGSFYIPFVQPETYSIRVDAPGFKSQLP